MKKTLKKRKPINAEQIARLADRGKDMTVFLRVEG